jgi:Uma2 family endonuclease
MKYNSPTRSKVIVEICQTRGQKNDLKKVIQLIEDTEYGILEGFVYNYKTREWFRYRKGDGGAAMASSVSEVMGIDMGGFV